MVFEPSIVVFDACVLYPFHLRNIIVQVAVDRLIEARWTDAIHEEWIRSVTASASAISNERLQVTRRLMNHALPRATVRGYEQYLREVSLPDPNDCHVVAAAIAANASIILTWNLRHFPAHELKKFDLTPETPDAVLSGIYDKVPELTIASLANARRNLTQTRVSASEFVDILRSQRLPQLTKRVRNRLADL